MPGLLQTKRYAYEVLGTGYPRQSDEDRDKLVTTRLDRAGILSNFHSPEVCFLLDEAVLRRVVGGPAVMCEQLRHIASRSWGRAVVSACMCSLIQRVPMPSRQVSSPSCGSRTCRPSHTRKA
ncbi:MULTISPECIES: Scr1 family TA system antitoxin-like transcriptional regulator [unclassified Streptomyces]|uniref:Scr1 family TA system antitoxin-like transcriptional regulator n=1 Tax=unclassified Streptomyces TaxID=2593676 RepID=UPI0040434ADB